MVYFDDWDQFAEAAEKCYLRNPMTTRYLLKYRHSEGKVVIKVTDNTVAIKYKTDQLDALKKIVDLNKLFIKYMTENPTKRKTPQVQN
uniref:Signal recognition particle 9 kDa protein n=1 Tax=Arcella intermedia TaxID=1963864 RepID=A0A6B2LUM8_9EUKA